MSKKNLVAVINDKLNIYKNIEENLYKVVEEINEETEAAFSVQSFGKGADIISESLGVKIYISYDDIYSEKYNEDDIENIITAKIQKNILK